MPPAPPDKPPHIIPMNGKAKSIFHQANRSSSPTIFPTTLPEKYATVAEMRLMMATTPKIHKSSTRKFPLFIKKRVKTAISGNVPSKIPKYAKACLSDKECFIAAASALSFTEVEQAFWRAVSALAARSMSNLRCMSSLSES